VLSINELEVQKDSLRLAQEQLERNRIQVEVGTMAPIEITQARAEVASREEGIIVAQTSIDNNEDALKTMVDLTSGAYLTARVVPTDQPDFVAVELDLNQEIQQALHQRPEILQERERFSSSQISRDYYRNQMKPQLDLTGSFGSTGLDGRELIYECNPFEAGCEPSGVIEGNGGGALKEAFQFDFRNWSVGANFTLPLGNDVNKALYRQYSLELQQSEARLRDLEARIALEVRQAVRSVQAAIKRIEATRVARELQDEKLQAEQKKFAVGTSTNFQVLEFQKDLTEAKTDEIRAIIDYNKALVALEQAKGTLLKKRGLHVSA
jgi:outer membrane protein TolC